MNNVIVQAAGPMKRPRLSRLILIVVLASPGQHAVADDFFESKIRPVLAETCFRCHGDARTSGGLRVDSRAKLVAGGESGPAIIPGDPEGSLLIQAIRRQADVSAMPPAKEQGLRPDQIADFVQWIKAGALWPESTAKFRSTKHWAFEPVRKPELPSVHDMNWVQSSVDRFIRAKQEAVAVTPAAVADKRTLIRRATFDLTGLPPTPEEIDAFLQDTSPRAFEAVVDRLLTSPAYGERWGRHWLDVVRYADTAGETADYPVPVAWRYRNYVIDAFNADKPYDTFLQEQIAGDILASQGPAELYAERVTATGYLAISRRFGFDSENYHHLTIQDTIDTLGQTVLGLSVGCARCHDHKFDPVLMQDYYGLYGIFDSTRFPFPGSEQKQKVRSMAALLPPRESVSKWHEYSGHVAELTAKLGSLKQPVPPGILRSLHDIDGDFELQAPAAGGSNGVLVHPWIYEGKLSVTNAAQSPYQNVYPTGRSGMSIPAKVGSYRVAQSMLPLGVTFQGEHVYVNLDFRVSAVEPDSKGKHRFSISSSRSSVSIDLLFASDSVTIQSGDFSATRPIKPNEWTNLQLTLNRKSGIVNGTLGTPSATVEFPEIPFPGDAVSRFDQLTFSSPALPDDAPAIEFDNLAFRGQKIASVSTSYPVPVSPAINTALLAEQLRELVGIDGDCELQAKEAPLASPWNAGPNSVVRLISASQSPFQNIYPAGELGLHMPNRADYDGFGLTLTGIKPDGEGRLYVGFDFRCANRDAGGNGSWRFYIGHGPGNSAAVELFFNGAEFFRRSGNAKESVSPLVISEWYQVQLTLDLKARKYTGLLVSKNGGKAAFQGELATGWDGAIDYSFIDSYGHIGGVRPSLDADNFVVSDKSPFEAAPVADLSKQTTSERRQKVVEIRKQLASARDNADALRQELSLLLAQGPFAMAYGTSEGTAHNVRMQMRGEPDRPGGEVPRGFIAVLGGGSLPADVTGSGRLELSRWLTRADNPLTPRVMVNRIWQYHFGRGLVKTPNDFGVRGREPTHPELLDHLATQFVQNGWSIKSIHRLILLSSTYQQSSEVNDTVAASASADISDLYASFPRRRLSAEEIRDTILMVSGDLDRTPGTEHPFPSPITWGYSQHAPFNAVYDHDKRSVYLMTQRIRRHPFLALFDGADPNTTTAERLATTVPTQALFFLNDPFIYSKSERWVDRLLGMKSTDAERIEMAWRTAIGRLPSGQEANEATEFLKIYRQELVSSKIDTVERRSLAAYLRTLIGSNEFLHVD